MEKWRRIGAFQSVQREAVHFHPQRARMEMKSVQLNAGSGLFLDLTDHLVPQPALRESEPEDRASDHRAERQECHRTECPVLPSGAHCGCPSGITSIFKRARASSSHLFARSFISRWT